MRKADIARHYAPDFVSAQTLGYRLELSERTVEDYTRAGLLPKPHMIGNVRRWSWAEVSEFIVARSISTAPGGDANGHVDEYAADIAKIATRLPKAPHARAS